MIAMPSRWPVIRFLLPNYVLLAISDVRPGIAVRYGRYVVGQFRVDHCNANRSADRHRPRDRRGGRQDFVGLGHRRHRRHCCDIRCAADRGLDSLAVWRVGVDVERRNAGVTADPLFVGVTRPPMRFGVTYTALLINAALTMETVPADEEPAGVAAGVAASRRVHAALRAGCALFRSPADVGEDAARGAFLQHPILEGRELQPAGGRSAGSHADDGDSAATVRVS